MTEYNRRAFLGVATAGLTTRAAFAAATADSANRRVLIAYATRCGSTFEIAQTMLQDLKGRGFAGDVSAAGKVTTLSGYDAVVVGSAVRFGKWLPEAVDFVRRYRAELNRMPTAFFTVHMMNTGGDEASRKARMAYVDPARALVRPVGEVFFAGKMDSSRLSFGERLLCKVMKARDADQRDWGAIHGWGKSVFAVRS
jgi:menaquinone-dependent protoporphyrinogen oxidase